MSCSGDGGEMGCMGETLSCVLPWGGRRVVGSELYP